jgi:hypothetical protein
MNRATAIELASRRANRNTLKREHRTGFRAFGVHALACLWLGLMAMLPHPFSEGIRTTDARRQFPSLDASGVDSSFKCASNVGG